MFCGIRHFWCKTGYHHQRRNDHRFQDGRCQRIHPDYPAGNVSADVRSSWKSKNEACLTFVSQAAYDAGIKDIYGLEKTVVPVNGCRNIAKKDMVFNNRTPKITVDPETYEVTVDGEAITSKPAEKLPLTQLYNLF